MRRAAPRAALAVALALLTAPATSPPAQAVDVEVLAGGGSVMAWSAPDQVGNAFALGALVVVDDLAFGVAGAMVYPDARTQGRFGAAWVEGRWAFLGRDRPWTPYAVVGLGLATGDDVTVGDPDVAAITPSRWVSDGPTPALLVGAGLRWGLREGLALALDLRACNHTQGAVSLLASYTF